MSFTIIKNLKQPPSYPMLCKLAEQDQVCVTGDERTGSFSGHGMEGDYQFGEDCIHGKFAGHGVTGTFSFEIGKAAVTISLGDNGGSPLPSAEASEPAAEGMD
jgi:hypothetical protein